jgi:hypothetical protein
MDGDGRETKWDDVLGDALLGDALLADEKRRRGLPLTEEEEELLGMPPRWARHSGGSSGLDSSSCLVALIFAGLFFFGMLCLLSLGG